MSQDEEGGPLNIPAAVPPRTEVEHNPLREEGLNSQSSQQEDDDEQVEQQLHQPEIEEEVEEQEQRHQGHEADDEPVLQVQPDAEFMV